MGRPLFLWLVKINQHLLSFTYESVILTHSKIISLRTSLKKGKKYGTMQTIIRLSQILSLLLSSFFVVSCATVDYPLAPDQLEPYMVIDSTEDRLALQHAPIFIVEEPRKPFNRIGTPSARYSDDREEEIYIDPDIHSFYYFKQPFATAKGSYTNLVYRIHFQKVPFSLFPFHLTTGSNTGIIVIVTLNEDEKPVLLTTVNTCGCYLGFTATSYTPKNAFPKDWNHDKGRWVFGEFLPTIIEYDKIDKAGQLHPTFLVRSNTHRVRNIWLDTIESLSKNNRIARSKLMPMASLEKLPLNGDYTSFFEEKGGRRGYVKNSQKPWERLLMSWWTFDWHIGEDKKYGPDTECNKVFYTSVKFWARQESDMWHFDRFLKYWGWNF